MIERGAAARVILGIYVVRPMTRLALLALPLLALAPFVAGQSGEHTLIATLADGEYLWVDPAGTENPTLHVPAASNVTIFIQQGTANGVVPHELQVGGGLGSGRIESPGESANVTFRSPPSGTIPYLCTIHPSTMTGDIVVGAPEESTDRDGVPGLGAGLLIALLGIAALARRGGAR